MPCTALLDVDSVIQSANEFSSWFTPMESDKRKQITYESLCKDLENAVWFCEQRLDMVRMRLSVFVGNVSELDYEMACKLSNTLREWKDQLVHLHKKAPKLRKYLEQERYEDFAERIRQTYREVDSLSIDVNERCADLSPRREGWVASTKEEVEAMFDRMMAASHA